MSVVLTLNPAMQRLMSGKWAVALCAEVAKEVLQETIGASTTSTSHFNAGQSAWPALSKRTLAMKSDKRKFVNSGSVLRAIRTAPSTGKLTNWNGAKMINFPGKRKKLRYKSNGIYSSVEIKPNSLEVKTGFAGELKHSAGFRKVRKAIALSREPGIGALKGSRREKAINRAVSVKETTKAIKAGGRPVRKFQDKKKDNLAYADIVQAGPFVGLKDNDSGATLNPHEAKKAGLTNYTEVRGKHPRPLLPYTAADNGAIKRAMDKGTTTIMRKLSE